MQVNQRANIMTRCYVSEQIAAHCDDPEPTYCPECESEMTCDDVGDLECDDIECGHVIIMNWDE